MVQVRLVRLPDDAPGVAGLDASFVAERELEVRPEGFGFRVAMHDAPAPRRKRYQVEAAPGGLVAVDRGAIVGYAEISYAAWNRRAVLEHLYVASGHRGSGTGTALLAEAVSKAQASGARCLWLETQNVNEPAIAFYLSRGFRICGLDVTLYDPAELPGEVAVFLAMSLNDS